MEDDLTVGNVASFTMETDLEGETGTTTPRPRALRWRAIGVILWIAPTVIGWYGIEIESARADESPGIHFAPRDVGTYGSHDGLPWSRADHEDVETVTDAKGRTFTRPVPLEDAGAGMSGIKSVTPLYYDGYHLFGYGSRGPDLGHPHAAEPSTMVASRTAPGRRIPRILRHHAHRYAKWAMRRRITRYGWTSAHHGRGPAMDRDDLPVPTRASRTCIDKPNGRIDCVYSVY